MSKLLTQKQHPCVRMTQCVLGDWCCNHYGTWGALLIGPVLVVVLQIDGWGLGWGELPFQEHGRPRLGHAPPCVGLSWTMLTSGSHADTSHRWLSAGSFDIANEMRQSQRFQSVLLFRWSLVLTKRYSLQFFLPLSIWKHHKLQIMLVFFNQRLLIS